ncbi:MAG: hypothetical protein MUF18_12630 [Fimbriiglobus sp.]|jgi:hypothetical protein|nr:hypothetical protein [Fimbriiglobus sp.]
MTDADTHTSPSRWPRTLAWLAVIVAMKLTLTFAMLVVVPRSKKTFDEYGLMLPWATKTLMQIDRIYTQYWFVLVPLKLALIVGGVIVGRHAFRTPRPGNVFAAVCLFVLAGSMAGIAVGLVIPQIKLMEGLSK